MRPLPRFQAQAVGATTRRFHTDEFGYLVPGHPKQWTRTGMPHHRVGRIPGIDAQRPIPGVVVELQFAVVLEHPLASAVHA
ncbi:hypothetical protein D3C81_2230230 [compost metagenome]